jgi:hypothetical protein
MNVLAALFGGTAVVGGAVVLGVFGKQKAGERIDAYPGSLVTLTFVSDRALSKNDVGAMLWSFQDNFPGTIEGFAAIDPVTVMANVVMNSPAALQIGSVGVFADILLQLVDAKIVAAPADAQPVPTGGQVYA